MTKVKVVLPLELKSDNSCEETLDTSELVSEGKSSFCESLNESILSSDLDLSDDSPKSNRITKMKNKTARREFEPYPELSLREKQRLDEKNSRRAVLVNEEIFRYGLTFGPYGSTQLQVDDHNVSELHFGQVTCGHRYRNNSSSLDSSEEEDVGHIDHSFDVHPEYVQYLDLKTDQDLIVDIMNLEDRVEEMERSLRDARLEKRYNHKIIDLHAELEKIRVYKVEIANLQKENESLRTENEHLQSLITSVTVK